MLDFHPTFETPEQTQIIWRYTDLGKYLAMLQSKALHFTRADRLDDPWEGEHSIPSKKELKEIEAHMEAQGVPAGTIALGKNWKHTIFVNCWHESEYESAAMWRSYGTEGYNLAICSSVQRIRSALESEQSFDVLCGRIKYIDYDRDRTSLDNIMAPYLRKRRSFDFEREVRLVLWSMADTVQKKLGKDPHDFEKGIDVPINVNALVKQVLVAPNAPAWFVEAVRTLTESNGLSSKIVSQSDINKLPV